VQKNKTIEITDLESIEYKNAWDLQQSLLEKTIDIKMQNRKNDVYQETPNFLLLCEHPHVYTIGKSGDPSNLLISEEELRNKKVEFFNTNRGGDITYHGPGQLVCYPILDLENFRTDIHLYLRNLEEVVISLLKQYDIRAQRVSGLTGVWTYGSKNSDPEKICAIGVRTSRWVTMHGLALNVNTNLDYFENIVPCGIDDKGVTSIAKELGKEVSLEEVKYYLIKAFAKVYNATIKPSEITSILSRLS